MTQDAAPWIEKLVRFSHGYADDECTQPVMSAVQRHAAVMVEAIKITLMERQADALERIADRLTPVAVINTPPDQAALFPEIQP